MDLPAWLEQTLTLALRLTHGQQLAVAFVLGSFAVATWSDLKHLAAQREFLEVWLFLLAGALALDVYLVRWAGAPPEARLLKWLLIAVLSALSLRQVGLLFRLAPGDVAALAAAASLLTPALVLLLYLTAKALSLFLGPLLARRRPSYPFMPVVSLTTVVVLAIGLAF